MNIKYITINKLFTLLLLINLSTTLGSAYAASNLGPKTSMRELELQSHTQRIQSANIEEAIAATEIGLNSGDQELRSMTLDAAFRSDNLRVQTTALRWIFSERKRISFQLINPSAADNGTRYTYKLWRGHVLKDFEFDPATDEISLRKSNFQGGHLVRGGFQLEYSWYPKRSEGYRCTFMAAINKEALKDNKLQLKGNIDCMFPSLKKHPAKGDEDGVVAFIINLS